MTQGLVPISRMFTPATAEQFNTQEFQIADTLGLKTTTWQQGDPSRTILAVVANLLALQDVDISILAQGGFLDYAATGSVTYTDPVSGEVTVYVTPDPSDPAQNPTGALGALDVLANSVYDVDRTLATPAGGTLAIVNLSLSTYGPFDAGSYHVSQPTALGSPTYNNVASLTIPPSVIAGTSVSAATNATPIVVTTSTNHGLSDGDIVFIDGALGNTAANGFWFISSVGLTQFTLDDSVGNGVYIASSAKAYVPQQEDFTADVDGSASSAVEQGFVNQAVTALVGVNVWNTGPWLGSDTESNVELAAKCRLKLQSLSPNGPKGAYEFFAKQAYLLAPLLTPPLALSTPVTKAKVVSDYFTGTVTTTIANAEGAPSAGDVTATDAVIQAFCVPQAVTAITQAAVEHPVAVEINVWLPAAYVVPSTQNVIKAAVTSYFEALPIGGVTDAGESPGPDTDVVPYNAVLGAVWNAVKANKIPVQQLTGTLDDGGGPAALNIQLALTPIPEDATIDGPVSVMAFPI